MAEQDPWLDGYKQGRKDALFDVFNMLFDATEQMRVKVTEAMNAPVRMNGDEVAIGEEGS